MRNETLGSQQNLIKTTGILTASGEDTLSSAFAHISSSHDAVVVTDTHRHVLGLVSPYYTSVRHRYPQTKKLKHCVYKPPRITPDTLVEDAIRLILETKIHFLPVIDEGGVLKGIITARRLLEWMRRDSKLHQSLSTLLAHKAYLQTINIHSSISEAVAFFKRSKRSKLVVLDENNHLRRLISVYDLMMEREEWAKPAGKQDRIAAKGKRQRGDGTRRVEAVMITHVYTVLATSSIRDAVDEMLRNEVGSIVVMKDRFTPQQIITTRDVLNWYP